MNTSIFYSWQSDLPSSKNRGFINQCLNSAIKKITANKRWIITPSIDRDTLNSQGTPEIVTTIFNKIDACSIFICDISIINSNQDGRKTPNPNVLIELGYAAKKLGWERIICIYNLDFGTYEDLPFNIKQRRHLTYKIDGENKSKEKERISKLIAQNISELHSKGLLDPDLEIYYKSKIDGLIYNLVFSLSRLLLGNKYCEPPWYIELTEIDKFFKYNKADIENLLKENNIPGFNIFQSYKGTSCKIEELIDILMPCVHISKEALVALTKIVNAISDLESFRSPKWMSDCKRTVGNYCDNYTTEEINFKSILHGYTVIRIKQKKGDLEIDYDDMLFENNRLPYLLDNFVLSKRYADNLSSTIASLIKCIKIWSKNTNRVLLFKPYIINID